MPVVVCNSPDGICYQQPDSFVSRDVFFPDENPYVVDSSAWQALHPEAAAIRNAQQSVSAPAQSAGVPQSVGSIVSPAGSAPMLLLALIVFGALLLR